ncbi:LOW QUALITY PROTEIN: putative methyltransferase TARBP1 [Aulostomus maculatus]
MMNAVLVKAVLSACPNYELLLESLRWPDGSWPGTEQLEAVTALLEGLGPLMLDSDPRPSSPATRQRVVGQVESLVWTQCLPLLTRISGEGGGARRAESSAAVCRLLSVAVPLCGEAAAGRLARSVLQSLQLSEEGGLSVELASELMAALLPSLSEDEQLTSSTLSSALSCIRTLPDVPKTTVRLLLALLDRSCGAGRDNIRTVVLDDLSSWHCSARSAAVTERVLLCLTALSDHLLEPRIHPEPRLSPQFWRMVQDGLIHRDSVTRKRALFLLKRCVTLSEERGQGWPPSPSADGKRQSSRCDCCSFRFRTCLTRVPAAGEIFFRWAPESRGLLREFWEDYALVMETLEENQVHVVRPVLNRIDSLAQTTANHSQGGGLLHPSWLLCVYQRMFHSENKTLMREGVCHLLELQLPRQPAFTLAFSQFVVGPFMDVLSETSLFHKAAGQSVGDRPELVAKLQVFLTGFFSSLPPEDRGQVLLQMIQQLGSKHWCAVPLLFLSQALSQLPPSPLLGADGLAALREVLRCTMITHQVLLRAAAQGFLLKSALCLLDVTTVTLEDVFTFLMHFRPDESLGRGTELWDQVCVWLSDNEGSFKPMVIDEDHIGAARNKGTIRAYIQSEVHNFLRVPASTGQTERMPDSREADQLARSILLCADMETRPPGADIGHQLETLVSPLLDTLSKVGTNIYLPLRKSDKSLQLVLRLLQLGGAQRVPHHQGLSYEVMAAIEGLIFKLVDPIQEFILRRLCGELQELCDAERAELYLCVLKQLSSYTGTTQRHSRTQLACFPQLIKYSLQTLQEPGRQVPTVANQIAKAVAMASLSLVCHLMEQQVIDMRSDTNFLLKSLNEHFYYPASSTSGSPSPSGRLNERLLKPHSDDTSSDVGGPSLLLQDWGRTAAHFLRDQWICLSVLTKAAVVPKASESLKAALSCSVEALALLPSDLVLPVLTFTETVLPQLVCDEEALCVEAVTRTWELVQGLSTNAHDFWPALRGFISMTFHQKLLSLTDSQAPTLTAAIKQIAMELMELSESKSGVFSVLILHCCQTWLPEHGDSGEDNFSSVFSHTNMLAEACVYGPVFRRDQRLVQDVQTYVERLGEECPANAVVASDNRDDQLPRTCALAFLSRLDPSIPQHQRLMEELVISLVKKDNSISKSKVRYYSNSLQHRVKNRVWQTLLLLLPKLKEEFVASLLTSVLQAGFCSNQASVKYLIEWMMVLILVRCPRHINSFWSCFSTHHDGTKTSICTFLSVLVHFSVLVPLLKDPAVQLVKALDVILQWCFSHNFSVRLYALLALKRVWSLVEVRGEEGVEGLGGRSAVVQACLSQAEAMQSSGNANKNWTRIQEHFFFGAFHPIRDHSAETIFYTFPRLSGLADDEWIPPWKFEKLSCFSESPTFPLRNPVPDLNQLQPGDWIQQDRGEEEKEERWAEVQKKITPWRLRIQEQDPELQLVPQQRAARVGKQPGGALLVVASLIDKPTNLGGLCRTCEIFGASALVLDSLRHISDKHFLSLSVSSELWLPLLEVKPSELSDFLQLKQTEGYCIVGVEQTANSQSLQDFHFPEKTLLLLGNEREGIPANLLQLLDVCVEIPQQGVIRSLNVHVSAALLIWEHTRQHLTSSTGEVNSRPN